MYRLYDFWESGNCYKVRLLLALLGFEYERVPIDIQKGETRTPDYLAMNPNGRVPLLELPDGRRLAESNAIQWYLAEGTRFVPDGAFERASALQWMCFEQYSHEPYIAVVRYWAFAGQLDQHRDELVERTNRGNDALKVMDEHLATRPYFVGESYSIADIALYAYTHVAPEGGFDLEPFPNVQMWLDRVRSEPGHVQLEPGA